MVRYRSYFWPALLILAGVIALLVNANAVPVDRLYRLVDLWPLILVVIGLELIARRAFQGSASDVASLLIVLLAAGGAVAYVAVGPPISAATQTLTKSDPVGNVSEASVEVDVGAAATTIRGNSELGTDLYRARIEYSGPRPDVGLDPSTGALHISQSSGGFLFFQSRRFVLDLQINPAVPWKITVNSGAASETLQLVGVTIGSIDLNTGASREDVTLGTPSGTVSISINGGAVTAHFHRSKGIEASVQVSGGVVSLNADGQQFHAVGSVGWQSNGYDGATDRYQIDVNGGACTVTMDTNAASS